MLYAKEIPEYRKIVQRYYKQIHDMPPLSEQEMNAHLAEESRVRHCAVLGRGAVLLGQRAERAAFSCCLDRHWREQTRRDILPQISRHKIHLT